ncbi:ATP-dependent metalloprotease FtsH [Longimicrobium terrae]|uniref:ATP-dependent metalloprotease FtsH n=1 Tax=Longimicrobium terrae TaxID=1639882 RepID=A0A841GS65_9BACT|nr:AAA family ATPase [Longimicrobium terrae]MBB4634774.1 ATP-dependent metalloprotease FtsH [Longimicrobium terrae]MBB6069169.1 ATP-dependent metalloprotease FtsH [Longimicrobium terrae]NNC32015.1 AAA family ATPase [Longimicrobium terrae]
MHPSSNGDREPASGTAPPTAGTRTGKPLPRHRANTSVWPMRMGIAGLVLLSFVAGFWVWAAARGPQLPRLAYTEPLSAVSARQVASLTVRPGDVIIGEWAGTRGAANGADPDFLVDYPVQQVDALAARAEAAGVRLTLATRPPHATPEATLRYLLTAALFIGLGFVFYRQMRPGGSNAELGGTGKSDVTFDDVAGTQGAAEELREMVDFLRAPDRFARLGARIPKGALLVGPPGTGKTLLARAVAGEAGVPFFSVSGSEVTGFLVGMGASRIKSLFKKARKRGGVIFIDEIDALGGKRGRNRSHNEDDRTLNQLLVEMDGFDPLHGVVVIAATNRPDDLDEALKRPGRFDRMVSVSPPNASGREDILRLHVGRRGIPLHGEVDLGRLARLTPGSTGAELANLLNEAAIGAAREQQGEVRWAHLDAARDRLLLGKERTGFRALDQERCTVAYHEAGHALVGVLCAPEDGLHKVTIQPRGQAMGVAYFAPSDDRFLYRAGRARGGGTGVRPARHHQRRAERPAAGERDRPQDGVPAGDGRRDRAADPRRRNGQPERGGARPHGPRGADDSGAPVRADTGGAGGQPRTARRAGPRAAGPRDDRGRRSGGDHGGGGPCTSGVARRGLCRPVRPAPRAPGELSFEAWSATKRGPAARPDLFRLPLFFVARIRLPSPKPPRGVTRARRPFCPAELDAPTDLLAASRHPAKHAARRPALDQTEAAAGGPECPPVAASGRLPLCRNRCSIGLPRLRRRP